MSDLILRPQHHLYVLILCSICTGKEEKKRKEKKRERERDREINPPSWDKTLEDYLASTQDISSLSSGPLYIYASRLILPARIWSEQNEEDRGHKK